MTTADALFLNPCILPLAVVAADPAAWLDRGTLPEDADCLPGNTSFGPPVALMLLQTPLTSLGASLVWKAAMMRG